MLRSGRYFNTAILFSYNTVIAEHSDCVQN